jgi:hypothetical protein
VSVAAPEQMAATGMVAAPEAAEGFVAVEVGVIRGAAVVATVGAAVGVLVGQNVGVAVGPAVASTCSDVGEPDGSATLLLTTVASNPAPLSDESDVNTMVIEFPVEFAVSGVLLLPLKDRSFPADLDEPSYTFRKSQPDSVSCQGTLSVIGALA